MMTAGSEPTTLVLFDLDGFKGYNDTFGHPAGDALLSRVGTRLATATAPYGSAYRLGGDEFASLVSSPDTRVAVAAAGSAPVSFRSISTMFAPVASAITRGALRVPESLASTLAAPEARVVTSARSEIVAVMAKSSAESA